VEYTLNYQGKHLLRLFVIIIHLFIIFSSAGTAAVSGAVRSLKEKIEQQTEVLNRLANATEKLSESSGFFLRNCALTDKYGYTRIQLEEGSKPFDVFCEQVPRSFFMDCHIHLALELRGECEEIFAYRIVGHILELHLQSEAGQG